jgi:hypothetical protein
MTQIINTRPSTNARPRRRRVARLVAAAALGAVALSVGPAQMASAHTDLGSGSPGTYSLISQEPAMLAVGERSTTSGWVATFSTDGVAVTPADGVAEQKVKVFYSLQQRVRPTSANPNPVWSTSETKSSVAFLNRDDLGGAVGTAFVSGESFDTVVAHTAGRGTDQQYRVATTVQWVNSATGAQIGVRQGLPNVPSEISCRQTSHIMCAIDIVPDTVGFTLAAHVG